MSYALFSGLLSRLWDAPDSCVVLNLQHVLEEVCLVRGWARSEEITFRLTWPQGELPPNSESLCSGCTSDPPGTAPSIKCALHTYCLLSPMIHTSMLNWPSMGPILNMERRTLVFFIHCSLNTSYTRSVWAFPHQAVLQLFRHQLGALQFEHNSDSNRLWLT